MAKSQSEVDNAANIQKFISQMTSGNGNNGLPASAASAASAAPAAPAQQQNGRAIANAHGNGVVPEASKPVDIPARVLSIKGTPTRLAASPDAHPLPSPHFSGLQAPQNTPYTGPASPLAMPAHLRKHNEDVGEAIADYVQNMDGKPLSESYWAPKNVAARAAAAPGGSSASSKILTPTNIVTPNPAINDSFERMSFKAADSDDKVDGHIFGDRITRSAFSNAAAKQPSPLSTSTTNKAMQPFVSVGAAKIGQLNDNVMTKAANMVGRVLAKASGSTPKDSQIATASTADAALIYNPRALEASGGINPELIPQPPKATASAKPVAEKPTEKTAGKPAQANGVHIVVDSTGKIVEAPKQAEALTKKLQLKEKELKDLIASMAAEEVAISNLRIVLHSKEKAFKHLSTLWEVEEVKLEEELTELRAELTRVDGLIALKEDELKALEVSNAPEGAKLARAVQDLRHELRLKEEAFEAADVLYTGEEVELEKEITKLREELKNMEATKAAPKVPVTVNATNFAKDEENLEHQTYFNAWPQSEKRDRARKSTNTAFLRPLLIYRTAAQIRKVILKNLPSNATPSFVASVVYFGPLEEIFMRKDNSATVKFLNPADCAKYYEDTSNGVVYKKDIQGREMVVFVELAKDVDVIGGLLQGWIDTGASRCVRVVDVEKDWGKAALVKLAEAKGRILEGLSDGLTPGGVSGLSLHYISVYTDDTSYVLWSSVSQKSTMPSTSKRRSRAMRTGSTAISITPWISARLPRGYTLTTRGVISRARKPRHLSAEEQGTCVSTVKTSHRQVLSTLE